MIYETRDYEVLVTTHEIRMQAQDDLSLYCLRNKTLGVIEGAAENLPSAINMCIAYQKGLDEAYSSGMKEGKKNGSITVLNSKDHTF